MKNVFFFVVVIVVGALLGSFLGQCIGMIFPSGAIHNLFANGITAGLQTTHLNLRVIDLTFGCMLKLNMTSVLGILGAALLFRKVF